MKFFKKILIKDILRKVNTKKIPLKRNECSLIKTEQYNLPARTATTQNQGLSCFVPRNDATVLINKISVSANGDFSAFWHDEEFTILQDSYALEGNGFELNREKALYIISAMQKALSKKYNWENKPCWNKIKNENIYLPATYDNEIDFELMENQIKKLADKQIEELERYLLTIGLNDYELTEDEKLSLSFFKTITYDNKRNNSNIIKDGLLIKEFKIGDLFDVKSSKKKFNACDVTVLKVGYPYVVRTSLNNGILGYINEDPKYLNEKNTISFGQDTATMFYQEQPYFTGDKIKILSLKKGNLNNITAQFFLTVMRKAFASFTWGASSFNEDIIKNTVILLPVTYTEEIDFELMEKYIRAIEKITIKKLYEDKGLLIDYTKKR